MMSKETLFKTRKVPYVLKKRKEKLDIQQILIVRYGYMKIPIKERSSGYF